MKVYAYIKIADHPQPDGTGMQKGDICYFFPMNRPQGNLTLNAYLPVVVDLTIPCGQAFQDLKFNCNKCQYNDEKLCEIQKYNKPVWSPGGLFEMPKPIKIRRYNIIRSKFISPLTEIEIVKRPKTVAAKTAILLNADAHEQQLSIIDDKDPED